MTSNRLSLCVLCGLLLFMTIAGVAQEQPNLEQGLRPYGSYHSGDIDNVNLSNGNLSVQKGLWQVPQRGKLDLDYFFTTNNKNYFINQMCDPTSGCFNYWDVRGDLSVSITNSQAVFLDVQTVVVGESGGQPSLFDYIYTVITPDGGSHKIGNFPHTPGVITV